MYDFDKASKLLSLYVTINEKGISQLLPIANAAMDELKKLMEDESNVATFSDPNPGVDKDTTDIDADGLVTTHDQALKDGTAPEQQQLDLSGKPKTDAPKPATTMRKV